MTTAPDSAVVPQYTTASLRVCLRNGDVLGNALNLAERVLLAGLGPLRRASSVGPTVLLLETVDGQRWQVHISPRSGLVVSLQPV